MSDTSETNTDTQGADTVRQIARDQMAYCRENPGVCADGNAHGWRWIRYVDDEWRATKYGGQHRLKGYVEGAILDAETALDWFVTKPVTIIPATEAFLWRPRDTTVWEDADAQDVFTDATRCFWCGAGERSASLDDYETHDHGRIPLCLDCHGSWRRAGELVDGRAEVTVGGE